MASTAQSLPSKRKRCVLAFFGIDRRLDITAPTITGKIVNPAKEHFEVIATGHLWSPQVIRNERSGEIGSLSPPRVELLPEGHYQVDPPLAHVDDPEFKALCTFGDFWQDGFSSMRNLYSQLISLKHVTRSALALQPDCVVFLRPDLAYHDSLDSALVAASRSESDGILLPHWQPHGGLNDRFAICHGNRAVQAYGQRLDVALEFCKCTGGRLHSERLLKFAIARASVPVERIMARASRVRIDGTKAREDFSLYGWKPTLRELAGRWRSHVWLGRSVFWRTKR